MADNVTVTSISMLYGTDEDCSSCYLPIKVKTCLFNAIPPSQEVQPRPARDFCGQRSLHSLMAPILALPLQLASCSRGGKASTASPSLPISHTKASVPSAAAQTTAVCGAAQILLRRDALTPAPPQLQVNRPAAENCCTLHLLTPLRLSLYHCKQAFLASVHSNTCTWQICSQRAAWHERSYVT